MFLATDSFSMPTNPLQSYHSAGLGVFSCVIVIGLPAAFQDDKNLSGGSRGLPLALAEG